MFYSKSTSGFYSIEIHGSNIPADAIEISVDNYFQLLQGQSNGKVISADIDGSPILTEMPLSPPVSSVSSKQFTSLDYLDLFTEDEQIAVVSATMVAPQIKLWYDKMLAAGYVTIADPRTEAGLSALVQSNLLTAERKLIILSQMQ